MPVALDVERCVDAIIARVGPHLRVAVPLGIGKPLPLLNALYRRVKADPGLRMELYTALTLERPKGQSELERRFLGPFVTRLFGDYPDPEYELDRVAGTLPANVRISEFYFYPGKLLGQSDAQRSYISSNYTHVARDLLAREVNVLLQAVCRGSYQGRAMLSLSSNADVSPDVMRGLASAQYPCVRVAQVNQQLPFMHGDALVPEDTFDLLVDDPSGYHTLFGTPKTSVADAEYLIGLYASALVPDGGSLQIGIGSIGDALSYALLLRHLDNAAYLRVLDHLGVLRRHGDVIRRIGGTAPFVRGLFAPTEMLVDGFMHLIEAGVVKRRVYDDVPLQRLLQSGRIDDRVTLDTLDALLEAGAICARLDAPSLSYLQRIGVLRPELSVAPDGTLRLPGGTCVAPDLREPATRQALERAGLGTELVGGKIVHAGFFLGPERLYAWLRALPETLRSQIDMRPVTRINQLHGNEPLASLQRSGARFVNTGMMATLFGAVVSDALNSGKVVSGVGGQYNFVAMAHELAGARSILQVRATRPSGGELQSNVVYEYGHATIPRHLRDIVITEYGIADLRGRTDEEVAEAMLAIADACAQPALLARAQREGKIGADFALLDAHRDNTAAALTEALAPLKKQGYFPAFPFGTELDADELELAGALRSLKERTSSVQGELAALAAAATHGSPGPDVERLLVRMGLGKPEGVEQVLHARLLASELRRRRGA